MNFAFLGHTRGLEYDELVTTKFMEFFQSIRHHNPEKINQINQNKQISQMFGGENRPPSCVGTCLLAAGTSQPLIQIPTCS